MLTMENNKNRKIKLFFYTLKDMLAKTVSLILKVVLTGVCFFGMLLVGGNILYLVWKAVLLTMKPFIGNIDASTSEGLAIIVIVGGYGIFFLVTNLVYLIQSVIKHMTSYFKKVKYEFDYKFPDQDTQVEAVEPIAPEYIGVIKEQGQESEYESDSQTFTWIKANTTGGLSTVVYTNCAYAIDEFGNGFSLTPKANSKYVGLYFSSEEGQILNPSDYEWIKIVN